MEWKGMRLYQDYGRSHGRTHTRMIFWIRNIFWCKIKYERLFLSIGCKVLNCTKMQVTIGNSLFWILIDYNQAWSLALYVALNYKFWRTVSYQQSLSVDSLILFEVCPWYGHLKLSWMLVTLYLCVIMSHYRLLTG